MKTNLSNPQRANAGYALVIVLVIAAIAAFVFSGTMTRTSNVAILNQRNNQYVSALNAAEAATEQVMARMRYDYLLGNETLVTNNLGIYRGSVPTANENSFWGNFEFSDGQGQLNQTYVQCVSNRTYTPLQSQFYGLYGFRTLYRVVSNSKSKTGRFNVTAACQQELELDSIPVFQFAIFYNGLLEFTWAAPLDVRGRTHANGPIFLGSAWPLRFYETVTTTSILLKTNWYGKTLGQFTGSITYSGSPTYRTNVPMLQLPVGTNNTAAAIREIINLPPATEDVNSTMGKERYYNKASIVMLVSNELVNLKIKNEPADASPLMLTYSITNAYELRTNLPFLTVTNTFRDQREINKTVKATQIDLDQYRRWTLTNASVLSKFPVGTGNYPNILYVADNRTVAGTELAAVRITNGIAIPTNGNTGFTLATPNPLYVWGHYNCPVSAHLGLTNTTATQPSSLISDAFTILSPNWRDSQSELGLGVGGKSPATSATVNAAVLTGVVFSTGSASSQFSGGVVNLPRLLEDWSSVTLTLNTSIVNFFNSVRATNRWQDPGIYYSAPSRNFNFDQNFRSYTKLPPGTPMLAVILRNKWTTPPPNTVTYAGP